MARARVAILLTLALGACAGGSPETSDDVREDRPEPSSVLPEDAIDGAARDDESDGTVDGTGIDGGDGSNGLLSLRDVEHWLYLIDVDLESEVVDEILGSDHELVVLDFIPSEVDNTDYPMAEVIDDLHRAVTPKLVLAYVDIGQAEDFRTYWEPGWEPGDPEWIVGTDPDGWEGDYPVAFWRDEWREIWLGEGGVIEQIVAVGFDGIYLDWVEAYSDENVVSAAAEEGVDARAEMIWWVTDLAQHGRALRDDFLVVAQNAAELVTDDEYATVIDGLAQEQVWFDGGADNDPPGDCPLPRTVADIETDAYVSSLSAACRRQHDDFPDSTLHVSSEEYLAQLAVAADRGLPVFTVDYALDPDNAAWVSETSRDMGFVPFVSSRALDQFVPAVP